MRSAQDMYGRHTIDMFLSTPDFWYGVAFFVVVMAVSLAFLAMVFAPRKVYLAIHAKQGITTPVWYDRWAALIMLMIANTFLHGIDYDMTGVFLHKFIKPLWFYASFMSEYVSFTTIFTKF